MANTTVSVRERIKTADGRWGWSQKIPTPEGKMKPAESERRGNFYLVWTELDARTQLASTRIGLTKHIGEIKTISFSPDGSLCVTGATNYQSTDQNALVWDVPSLSVVGELKGHRDGIYSSAWSPTGEIIATGGGGTDHAVRLWDATSRQIGEIGRDLFIVHALAFSPDGRFLLTGSANNAPVASVRDGSCFRVWDVRRRKEVARLGVPTSSVQSVVFSRDGRIAACGSSGQFMSRGKTESEGVFCPQTIRLWDITTRFWGIRATEKFVEAMEHTA